MNAAYRTRCSIIFFTSVIFYTAVLINLAIIQLVQRPFFTALANKQYSVRVTTTPPRALIFDRNGTALVCNKESYSAFITPHKLSDPASLSSFLQQHFPAAYTQWVCHKNKQFIYVKRRLTAEEYATISDAQIPDIHIMHEPSRWYAHESLTPVIGTTGIDNTGLFGIEQQYNTTLAGAPSTVTIERDARSGHWHFDRQEKNAGSAGTPVTLTIDSDLQFLAYEELKKTVAEFAAREGALIIMDPHTGHIMTMASAPTFNPNEQSVPDLALTKNRVISESYEPGSVMKALVGLAALEAGVVTADEEFDCQNTTQGTIDGMPLSTVLKDGIIPFSRIIERSNNIGIAQVTKRMGPVLYDHLSRLGFGKKTGITLPGEQPGSISNPRSWSKRSLISLSFGYEMTATLLQIAQAFAIIANGGYSINPTIIYTQENRLGQQLYSTESVNTIKEILYNTVTQGTARRAAIDGYRVMAKTGTANIAINGSYAVDKNIYTCAAIIERDGYARVIAAYIRESQLPDCQKLKAATVVVPLIERVMKIMLIHDAIL